MRVEGSASAGVVGFTRSAILLTDGSSSRISSSRFGPSSTFMLVAPVTLPPGPLLGGAAAWPLAARAQQPTKVLTVGFIGSGSPDAHACAPPHSITSSAPGKKGRRHGDADHPCGSQVDSEIEFDWCLY